MFPPLLTKKLKAIIEDVDDEESEFELFSCSQLVDVSGVLALANAVLFSCGRVFGVPALANTEGV